MTLDTNAPPDTNCSDEPEPPCSEGRPCNCELCTCQKCGASLVYDGDYDCMNFCHVCGEQTAVFEQAKARVVHQCYGVQYCIVCGDVV